MYALDMNWWAMASTATWNGSTIARIPAQIICSTLLEHIIEKHMLSEN